MDILIRGYEKESSINLHEKDIKRPVNTFDNLYHQTILITDTFLSYFLSFY